MNIIYIHKYTTHMNSIYTKYTHKYYIYTNIHILTYEYYTHTYVASLALNSSCPTPGFLVCAITSCLITINL